MWSEMEKRHTSVQLVYMPFFSFLLDSAGALIIKKSRTGQWRSTLKATGLLTLLVAGALWVRSPIQASPEKACLQVHLRLGNGPPVVLELPFQTQEPVYRPVLVRSPAPWAPKELGITDHFRALMAENLLISQGDDSLQQRGLLVPEGGLCATTSAVHALHAAFRHLGRDTSIFQSQSDWVIHRMIYGAWQSSRKARNRIDARFGVSFDVLMDVVNRVGNEFDSGVGIHAEKRYGWRLFDDIELSALRPTLNTLILLSVSTPPDARGGRTAHALTLLDIESERWTISYSDPNDPCVERWTKFFPARRGGSATIQIEGFGNEGYLLDVISITAEKIQSDLYSRWRAFSGKRAWITYKDGSQALVSVKIVERPSPEYPAGSLVAYSHLFHSGGGGRGALKEIQNIEAVTPPNPKSFYKYRHKRVRFRFRTAYWSEQYGQRLFDVLGFTTESDFNNHPFGGIRVEQVDTGLSYTPFKGVVPYEAIESIAVVGDGP